MTKIEEYYCNRCPQKEGCGFVARGLQRKCTQLSDFMDGYELGTEKMNELKKLAEAMYLSALNMSTDASRLRKAMDNYHQWAIKQYRV